MLYKNAIVRAVGFNWLMETANKETSLFTDTGSYPQLPYPLIMLDNMGDMGWEFVFKDSSDHYYFKRGHSDE